MSEATDDEVARCAERFSCTAIAWGMFGLLASACYTGGGFLSQPANDGDSGGSDGAED